MLLMFSIVKVSTWAWGHSEVLKTYCVFVTTPWIGTVILICCLSLSCYCTLDRLYILIIFNSYHSRGICLILKTIIPYSVLTYCKFLNLGCCVHMMIYLLVPLLFHVFHCVTLDLYSNAFFGLLWLIFKVVFVWDLIYYCLWPFYNVVIGWTKSAFECIRSK